MQNNNKIMWSYWKAPKTDFLNEIRAIKFEHKDNAKSERCVFFQIIHLRIKNSWLALFRFRLQILSPKNKNLGRIISILFHVAKNNWQLWQLMWNCMWEKS